MKFTLVFDEEIEGETLKKMMVSAKGSIREVDENIESDKECDDSENDDWEATLKGGPRENRIKAKVNNNKLAIYDFIFNWQLNSNAPIYYCTSPRYS